MGKFSKKLTTWIERLLRLRLQKKFFRLCLIGSTNLNSSLEIEIFVIYMGFFYECIIFALEIVFKKIPQ